MRAEGLFSNRRGGVMRGGLMRGGPLRGGLIGLLLSVCWLGLCCFALIGSARAADQALTLHVSLGEFAPYAGAELPELGAVPALLRKALANSRFSLVFSVMTRAQAVDTVTKGQADLAFPATLEKSGPILSRPLFLAPIALAERRGSRHNWGQMADLKQWRLGVSIAAPLPDALVMSMAEDHWSPVKSPDDTINLRRLAARDLDLIAIDANLFRYLRATDIKLGEERANLEINPKLLDLISLHFGASAKAAAWLPEIDALTSKVDASSEIREYLFRHGF